MTNRYTKLFFSDIRYIAHKPVLFCALLSPVIFTLFLLFCYPLIAGLIRGEDAIPYGKYYSITAITLISAIPFIYGQLFAFSHLLGSHSPEKSSMESTPQESGNLLISGNVISAILGFIVVLPVIYLTDAVSSEGWLRSIYAAFLLAIMASFIFLFKVSFAGDRIRMTIFTLLSVLYLITVPAGLLLHHPWNYFAFFSPFYWLSWAWVIPSPAESLTYGIISLLIAAASMLIFYRYYRRK